MRVVFLCPNVRPSTNLTKARNPLFFSTETKTTVVLFSVKMKKCLKTDCHCPHSMFGIKFDR